MTARDQLRVRVNDELVVDAGTCEEVSRPHGPERLIRSPKTTLSQQVLAYLRAKPDPPRRPSGSMVGREGVAAAALALRWGSYLAVLLDRDKPVWPEVRSASTSRISDEETARINIEASAALATWIDLYREDPGGRLYTQLVDRAVYYLPMPKKTSKLKVTEFRGPRGPRDGGASHPGNRHHSNRACARRRRPSPEPHPTTSPPSRRAAPARTRGVAVAPWRAADRPSSRAPAARSRSPLAPAPPRVSSAAGRAGILGHRPRG